MGYLTRRSSSSVGKSRTSSGVADKHVDDCDWSDPVRLFTDLDVQPPAGAGPEVTSTVELDPRVRKHRDDGHHYRKQFAWWAGRGGIIIVGQHQHLTQRQDGKFQPAGAWETVSSEFYQATEPARRRVADLPTNPHAAGDPDFEDDSTRPSSEAVLGLLPEPARRAFLNGVEDPVHVSANAIRFSFPEKPAETIFVVSALRMDHTHGIVIYAEHRTGATAWKVNQISYAFQPATPLIPASEPANTRRRILRRH